MKFYKKSLLNLFTIIACLFFCLTSKNVNISKADSNEIIEIGGFYTTINVTNTVKVYVSGEEINWAIDCGFEIYTEFFNPNFLLNQLEHVITPPVTLYFYYATPTHPRITGKRTLYNDVDSLIFLVNYMESIASSSNISDPKNAVL